jgi:hypothetical protein
MMLRYPLQEERMLRLALEESMRTAQQEEQRCRYCTLLGCLMLCFSSLLCMVLYSRRPAAACGS